MDSPLITGVPIPPRQPSHHLSLEIIGEAPARPLDKATDLSIGLAPRRLINSVDDAPKNARLVPDGDVPREGQVLNVGDEILVMRCISYGMAP
jgi:hypothetical protein